MPSATKTTFPFTFKLAAILICLIALGFVAVIGQQLLTPLVFALLFAILLLPLSQYIEKRSKLGRGPASFSALLIFAAGITLIVYFVATQIGNLTNDWPQFQQQLNTSLVNLEHWVSRTFHYNVQKQKAYINNATSDALSNGSSVIGTTLLSLSSILLFTVLTLIYTFFLLLYRSTLIKFLVALVAEENSSIVYDVVSSIQLMIRKYILGLLLEMLIVASICWLSFGILGIKYFLLLGLITALFNIVPYVGIFTALLLSAVITFATNGISTDLLLVVITIVVIHLVDSNILLPFIVGSKVSINALITVIGVVLGEMMWGLPGMFLSVPVIAMTKIICDRVEPLKPWAILLGHEKEEKKVMKFPRRKKKTVVVAEENNN